MADADDILRSLVEGRLKHVSGFVIPDEVMHRITEQLYSGRSNGMGNERNGWHPCLKQKTRCLIVMDSGEQYEATNSCHVEDATVCPRVTAGSPSGEEYDLCGPPIHAEVAAVALVRAGGGGGVGTAYLFGHDWLCGPCQHALQSVGIQRFVITGGAA